MTRRIDNSIPALGMIAIADALSDPLKNTKEGMAALGKEQNSQNVFQHTREFWLFYAAWGLLSYGTIELFEWTKHTHSSMAGWGTFVAAIGMFVCFVGMPFPGITLLNWYVRSRCLTRIFPIMSLPWRALTQSHGISSSTARLFAMILTIPYVLVIGPILLIYDALRFIRFVIAWMVTGGKVQFGGNEFMFYKRQAARYNKVKASHGAAEADYQLYLSARGTDIPAKFAQIKYDHWKAGIREQVMAPKIAKYGNLLQ
ncbi:hypothetical protein [Mangrovitalea sediminis]|uniref:hypothetical protein n=1 Tax=Mangrovitalea sediminis TaxID=1982043 RepID=UPI000BE52BC9|nr:hypothetical protein [Mangrovitalea sediminis]